MSNVDRICGVCNERYGMHQAVTDNCPEKNRDKRMYGMFTETKFKEKEMSKESINPYKYGDMLITEGKREVKVLGICGDLVGASESDNWEGLWCWKHWKEMKNWGRRQPNTWKDLTEDNWKERRDKVVWWRYESTAEVVFKAVLIWWDKASNSFYLSSRGPRGVEIDKCSHISIYNNNGEEATI